MVIPLLATCGETKLIDITGRTIDSPYLNDASRPKNGEGLCASVTLNAGLAENSWKVDELYSEEDLVLNAFKQHEVQDL